MSDESVKRLAAKNVVAVVLAGGKGTRIRHLAPDVPKPMISVLGRPFLEWIVRYLADQGIQRVVLSTGFQTEIVERHFEAQSVPGVTVSCVRETKPLGTAGGFLNAARHTQNAPEAWLVMNGDSMTITPLADLIGLLDDPATCGGLLGVSGSDAERFGTLDVGPEGELLGFREKRKGAGIINAGVYVFRSRVLDYFGGESQLSFEHDVFPKLAANNAGLKVWVADAPFLDIGTPETLPLAESFLRSARIPILT